MGSTDCTLPIQWALDNKEAFDVIIVYTDCDMGKGQSSPSQMLKKYRTEMGIPNAG